MHNRLNQQNYLIRKKVISFLGGKFHVYDQAGNVVLFSKMKAFKLKEDIRLYSDESMQEELLRIAARSIIDFGATYDVLDAKTGENLGALRRKGLKSMISDTWLILDPHGNEVGMIKEDSMFLSLVRRLLFSIIPQSFNVHIHGAQVARFTQRFNPFVQKLELDFSLDTNRVLDKRLGMAAGVLLSAIEGRQQ